MIRTVPAPLSPLPDVKRFASGPLDVPAAVPGKISGTEGDHTLSTQG